MQSVPGSLWEWLATIEPSERFPLAIVAITLLTIALVMLAAILAMTVRGIHKRRLEDSLKRELLDRGMSAEEIAMVVRATPSREASGGS